MRLGAPAAPAPLKSMQDFRPLAVETVHSVISQYRELPLSALEAIHLPSGSSKVLKVSAPDCRPVIFRKFIESPWVDPQREQHNFDRMSQLGFGPKSLAVGSGYRIEEFLYGTPMRREDMQELADPIVRKLATLHLTESGSGVPISAVLFESWAARYHQCVSSYYDSMPLASKRVLDELTADLRAEQSRALALVSHSEDLVFSHGDARYQNVLRTGNDIQFVDFEYSGLHYPAYDLATYESEAIFEYNVGCTPSFTVHRNAEFTKAQVGELVGKYAQLTNTAEETLWAQWYQCRAIAHYLAFVWALSRYRPGSEAAFDILGHGQVRMSEFRKALEHLP